MFLSIDIGGTTIKYGVVDEQGHILFKNSIPTVDDKEVFYQNLLELIEETRGQYPVQGIGICAPGIIQKNGYMTTAGAIKSLYGENIKSYIEAQTNLPVTIDNDANAVAISEKWLGKAKEMKNYICLVLGTGVGCGIVINNEVYAGSHGMAGEFGWNIIHDIPQTGPIEVSSVNAKAATISGLCMTFNEECRLLDPDHQDCYDAREIFALEETGHEIALRVVENFFTDLTIAIFNLVSTFDPDAILIGGGISNNVEFERRLQETLVELKKRHDSLYAIREVISTPVLMTELKNDAGMLGAAYQIKKQLIGTK